jgi:hypothetical protein
MEGHRHSVTSTDGTAAAVPVPLRLILGSQSPA